MTNLLDRLLDDRLVDPDGTDILHVPTRHIAIRTSLAGSEADLVSAAGIGQNLVLVSDPATRAVLGARVHADLSGQGRFSLREVVLGSAPAPTIEAVAALQAKIGTADGLVAIGSGSLNDIVKQAAFRLGLPYVVFATAPSMNGYTSASAAIIDHGHKKSLSARAPVGAFFDLTVLCAAPPRMIRSGFGDSLCRATAQTDWLMAHLLLDRPYRRMPFVLLEPDEDALIASADRLLVKDIAAMERLVRTLVMSGFGMTLCGSSEPASQGEHLISHYIDMRGDPAWPMSYHGEHIAVTTLTMARIQEGILNAPAPPVLKGEPPDRQSFLDRYGEELGTSCWEEFVRKRIDAPAAEALNRRLASGWPDIRKRLLAVGRSAATLRTALATIGAPTTPEEIWVPAPFYREAAMSAREIRNRFCFLDLAAESGQLAGLVS